MEVRHKAARRPNQRGLALPGTTREQAQLTQLDLQGYIAQSRL
jgi:hypothetical protein